MGRKRNPYLPLYTRDIMSSPRCRALSTTAAGVYLFLLCRLNEPPTPGAFRLSDWEQHPTWRRSLTQQCIANTDKQARLQYFARYLSKNDLPWDRKEVLAGLQELFRLGIIIVEGDMIVQPRMYKDNGFSLPDLDNDSAIEDTILDKQTSGAMASNDNEELMENNDKNKGTENGTKKTPKTVQKNNKKPRARASRALSVEYENNIENNIGDSKETNKAKTEKSKKDKTSAVPARQRPVMDNPPSLEDVQAYFDERAAQGNPLLYITAEDFYSSCETDGWTRGKDRKPIMNWKTFAISCNQWRRSHGDRPVGSQNAEKPSAGLKTAQNDAVPATPPKEGKYKKW